MEIKITNTMGRDIRNEQTQKIQAQNIPSEMRRKQGRPKINIKKDKVGEN